MAFNVLFFVFEAIKKLLNEKEVCSSSCMFQVMQKALSLTAILFDARCFVGCSVDIVREHIMLNILFF